MVNRLISGFGISLMIALILVFSFFIYRYFMSSHRNYLKQVERNYSQTELTNPELITAEDLEDLPDPVKKYLQYVGVIGTERVHSYSVRIDGEFKISREQDWAPVKVEQVSFTAKPVRLFFMKLKFMGINIFGLHHYESAAASMVIKVLDIIKVADARGAEMNRGETVTVFNDVCMLAPAALIDPRISWKQIDDLTVEGSFTNMGITVTGILYFNKTGQLVNFVSDDRYYWNRNNTYEQISWSTPMSNYRQINGLNLAGYGEAVWMREDGPFTYAKFNIRDVTINPDYPKK